MRELGSTGSWGFKSKSAKGPRAQNLSKAPSTSPFVDILLGSREKSEEAYAAWSMENEICVYVYIYISLLVYMHCVYMYIHVCAVIYK